MTHIQLGSQNVVSVDLVEMGVDSVTFDGGCIAIASFNAGRDLQDGLRMTTIITGYIDDMQVAESGAIDYNVEHNSPGPSSLTIAVPIGYRGSFKRSGGRASAFRLTLVRNAI